MKHLDSEAITYTTENGQNIYQQKYSHKNKKDEDNGKRLIVNHQQVFLGLLSFMNKSHL